MPESKSSLCWIVVLWSCLCLTPVAYHNHGYSHHYTGSHVSYGECTNCDCLEYDFLQSLRNSSNCYEETKVYRVLETLSHKSTDCRIKIINELAGIYSDVSGTPSNCHCTGHNTLQTFHDNNKERIFNNYYDNHHSNNPVKCRSHHSMWSLLSKVSTYTQFGGGSSCQKMLVEHLGERFKHDTPCHCSSVSTHQSETTSETTTSTTASTTRATSTTSTTTTTKQTTTKLPAKPTATSATTSTSTATDIITATQPVSAKWTCGKFSTVESIALQHHLTHQQATQCQAANDHGSDEAFVLINCNVPEPNIWKQGINVMQNCHQIPTYTPVATFIGSRYYPSLAESGVFMGCIENGFKLGVQHCNDVPTIDHVLVNSTGLQNAEHFFVIN